MNVITTTINAKYIHTNLAIRYLKAYTAPEFDIQMIEYTIKDPIMHIVTDLYQQKPDVVMFSCYIWNIEQTLEVITLLKKIRPELITIVGGPEVSYEMEDLIKRNPSLDFVITGEGEATAKHLLTEIAGTKNYDKIQGIGFLRNGETVITPPRPYIDLNTIPSPFRFPEDIPHLSKRIAYVETSRGCPFRCQFCLSSIEFGVRYFDIERMKDEIRFLMKHGAKTIKFLDRTFNINRKYALEMFQFLIDEHVEGTVFQFEITGDIMRPEVVQFLNDHAPAGLFRFEIGVQSTNEGTNEIILRKQNFDKLSHIINLIKQGGKIAQHLDLIAGLPEENYDSFKKTFNDVFALRAEEVQLGFLKMLKGTGLRNRAAQHDYVYMDKPPYEILSNHVLSFDDIIRIKQVEDVLEKYWNDGRMNQTVEYLISHTFATPFDFFQSFGTYWEKQGWQRIGHQLEDLFRRLYAFLEAEKVENLDIILGLMKIDYLEQQNIRPRKLWWGQGVKRSTYSPYFQQITEQPELLGESFVSLNLSQKDIYKHIHFDFLPFDYEAFKSTGKIVKGSYAIFSYHNKEKDMTKIFFLKK